MVAYRNQASMIFHDFPQAFAARFYGCEGIVFDPVLAQCRRQAKPVSWRQYERTPFYREAQEFGLLDGITVPAHGPGSLVVAVTLAGRALVGPREAAELPAALDALGREAIQMVNAQDGSKTLAGTVLTERQALVLHLLAEGLAHKDVARRLGISVTAVGYLVSRAMNLLGATNQTHAVALAILEGKLGTRQPSL